MSIAPSQPLRILVVDDHGDTVSALSRLLRREGHEVATAHTASAAMAEAASGRPVDLLVSDIGLPDFDGCELLRRLRDMYRREVPAVALTGYGEEQQVEECRRAGYGQFLLKPIAFEKLRDAVRAVMPQT
jgi:CheY-like chemotaxis protein